jgi:hypothetical protein
LHQLSDSITGGEVRDKDVNNIKEGKPGTEMVAVISPQKFKISYLSSWLIQLTISFLAFPSIPPPLFLFWLIAYKT